MHGGQTSQSYILIKKKITFYFISALEYYVFSIMQVLRKKKKKQIKLHL